ncbi:cilia- and flagella-associated protein 53 [Stigmatopora argus]
MLPARRAMMLRHKQEQLRERATEAVTELQTCGVTNKWLRDTDDIYFGRLLDKDVNEVMMQQLFSVQERRDRLRGLLDDEERRLILKARRDHKTPAVIQAQMRERAQNLQETREALRRQTVAEKLDQQFRLQCQELREAQSKQRLLQVCHEREAQVRGREEDARLQRLEDDMFYRLWRDDTRAKEEREKNEETETRHRGRLQMEYLRQQMEAAEGRRQQERRRRQEEAEKQGQEMQTLRDMAHNERRLQQEAQETRRAILDDSLRLKLERVAKERQEELQVDLAIVQRMLDDENQAKQDHADKRADLREEQVRFCQYLSDQSTRRKKEEEEMERMMAEKMKETWDKREEQNLMQQEARNRLMIDCIESQRLQTAQKRKACRRLFTFMKKKSTLVLVLDLSIILFLFSGARVEQCEFQRRADQVKERAELDASARDMKRAEEELAKRQRQNYVEYQVELRAQMEKRQREKKELQDEELKEQEWQREMERQKLERKDRVLAQPDAGASHPFRIAAIRREREEAKAKAKAKASSAAP